MFKKIALILLSTSLCVAEPAQNSKLFNAAIFVGAAGICIVAAVVCIQSSDILHVASGLNTASVEKFGKILNAGHVFATVGLCVGGAAALQPLAKDMKTYFSPTEKEKVETALDIAEAVKGLKLLEAEEEFRKCLLKNALNRKKGIKSLPAECEATAEALVICGGRKKIEEMKFYFNKD